MIHLAARGGMFESGLADLSAASCCCSFGGFGPLKLAIFVSVLFYGNETDPSSAPNLEYP